MAQLSQSFAGSSNLQSGTYDTDSRELVIVFNNGGQYRYSDVPPNIWEDLITAPSAGSFFHHNIRQSFSYERL
jgi:KTSC domain-containing protein